MADGASCLLDQMDYPFTVVFISKNSFVLTLCIAASIARATDLILVTQRQAGPTHLRAGGKFEYIFRNAGQNIHIRA